MNPSCPSKPILVEGNPLDQAIVLSVGRVLLHFALVIEDGLFLKESIAGMGRPMQNENPYIYIIYIYILYIVYIYMYPIYCRYLACPCNHIGTRTDISVLKAKGFPNFLQPHLLQVQLPPRNLIIQLESERVPSMCERSAKFLHQQHPTRSVYLLLLNIFNIFSNGQSPFLKVPHVCTKRANINCYPQLNSRFFSLVTVTALYKLFGLLRFRSNSFR